jgi:acetyltransferase-like isoleucine patch superfamily enzyme
VLRWAKRHEPEALRAIYGARRAAFVSRLKLLAAWYGSEIEIDIAPDVRLGKNIAVTVWPGTRNVVRIGPGTRIGDRVEFILKDGRILIGDAVEIRRGTTFMMWGGTLELEGGNILSWGNVIHCANSIRLARLASTNEWVTLVDSSHYFTEIDRFFYDNTKTDPIEIGYNTWICSKATIARGAKVGDHCIIAGNSIVTGEVPSGHLASGVPAAVIRELSLPWKKTAPQLVADTGRPPLPEPLRRRANSAGDPKPVTRRRGARE